METENIFGTLPVGKLIAKMSIPIIIEMLVQSLYNIIDSLFVAQLGLNPLSAIGLAYPVQMAMIALSTGIGAGMTSIISQRLGTGDDKGARKIAGNAITICVICSVVMLLFGIFGVRSFFSFCTGDTEIMKYGTQYLSVICIFSFGQFLSIAAERLLQTAGRPTWGMIVHLIGCAFNLIFDPILIFGYFGFPVMGVTGAAIATVGGQIVSTVIAFFVCIVSKKGISFGIKDLIPSKDMLAICKIGIPAAAAQGISAVMSFGMNQILKHEVIGLAVFTAYYKLWSIVGTPVVAVLQGTVPIVGYNYGAGKKERVTSAIKIAIFTGIVMMIFFTVIFQIFPKQMIALFDNGTNGDSFILQGTYALRIISCIFIFYAFGQIASNIFQAMGNGVPSLIYALFHQCILLLPTAYLLLKFGGANMVWYSYWFAEIVSVIIVAFIFRHYYKKFMAQMVSIN